MKKSKKRPPVSYEEAAEIAAEIKVILKDGRPFIAKLNGLIKTIEFVGGSEISMTIAVKKSNFVVPRITIRS